MATRFYFPFSETTPVSPAFGGNSPTKWGYTVQALRRRLSHTKGTSAITVGTRIGPWVLTPLDRQYVSDAMNGGTVFDPDLLRLSMQIMVREYDDADNVGSFILNIFIVSNDGNTVKTTILNGLSFVGEFINDVSHRNEIVMRNELATGIPATYISESGDRLVIEIGYSSNSGITPEASAKWGENAADLPWNDTQTTDGAAWIEFTNTPFGVNNSRMMMGCGV